MRPTERQSRMYEFGRCRSELAGSTLGDGSQSFQPATWSRGYSIRPPASPKAGRDHDRCPKRQAFCLAAYVMFIVWGTKRIERALGFAADFCPVCRQVQPVRVARIGMASHVYYISFGQGQLVGYQAKCSVCSLAFETNPIRDQQTVLQTPKDIEALIDTTFPSLRQNYSERLSLEEQVRLKPHSLNAEQREALVLEPLTLLAPVVEAKLTGHGEF